MNFDDELRLLNEGRVMTEQEVLLESIERKLKEMGGTLQLVCMLLGVALILMVGSRPGPT